MNNSDKVNSLIYILIALLSIALIVLLVVILLRKKTDIEKEFLNDMNNLNGPLYYIIENQKNYDDIINYIYKNNKEQIDAVYNNKYTKQDFKDLIKSNCIHNELTYKILENADKIILNILTYKPIPGQGKDHLKGVIIFFLTLVYLYYKSNNKSKSKGLNEMCSILACDSQKSTVLQSVSTGKSITRDDLTGTGDWGNHALFNKTSGEVNSSFLNFINIFNKNTSVNHQFFTNYNNNTIMPVLNKIKIDLDKTICEKYSNKSTYNAAHNLLVVINNNLGEIIIKEILDFIKLPHVLPPHILPPTP